MKLYHAKYQIILKKNIFHIKNNMFHIKNKELYLLFKNKKIFYIIYKLSKFIYIFFVKREMFLFLQNRKYVFFIKLINYKQANYKLINYKLTNQLQANQQYFTFIIKYFPFYLPPDIPLHTMESDETFIEKTFEIINELTNKITLVTIKVLYLTSTRQINISRAMNDIHSNGSINFTNSHLFYFDTYKRLFVHIGTFPFDINFQLLLKFELFLQTTIKIRFRKLSGPNALSNSPKNSQKKSQVKQGSAPPKRTRKQKTIQQVIQLVNAWRTLFQMTDNNGKKMYSLETAAQKLNMQKKTLDDYYYKLKKGQAYGFDMQKHKNQKIGLLRQFIKNYDKNKKINNPTNKNSYNNGSNQNWNQALGYSTSGNGMGVIQSLGGGINSSGGCSQNGNNYTSYQKPSEDEIDKYLVKDSDSAQSSSEQSNDRSD